MSRGAADEMSIGGAMASASPAAAMPAERRGLLVPGPRGLLEPGADLDGTAWVLPGQGTALENALDRFGHVEPAAAERGVERHDAVLAQPDHHLGALVAGKIVPHEQQTQWRQMLGQGEAFRQSVLPALPRGTNRGGLDRLRRGGQRGDDCGQGLLEPAMQDRVRAPADRLDIHLPGRRLKQGQELACAAPDILMGLGGGAPVRLPGTSGMRHRLERPGLVFAPNRQAKRGGERVGSLDQPLFATASGSVTVTGPPRLRLRTTAPVSHQVRLFCQPKPASCRVRPIV
jgi:hypothetical protein